MIVNLSQGIVLSFDVRNPKKPVYLGVRKFVPVFDRTKVVEVYKYPTGLNFERVKKEFPRYERGSYNFWVVQPTSLVKTMWAIYRVKQAHRGQLKLL